MIPRIMGLGIRSSYSNFGDYMEFCKCGEEIHPKRISLGYRLCLPCGEKEALKRKHTIVPMPKSNYIVVTDLSLLKGLNSSHKGGVT